MSRDPLSQCAACHRPGGVAPFSLLTYQDASKRSQLIATITGKRGCLRGCRALRIFRQRRLSDAEIATLAHWAAAGAARGRSGVAPAAPHFRDGWQLGAPDLGAKMVSTSPCRPTATTSTAASSRPADIPRDRWVRAVDMPQGNPQVVHHAILFRTSGGTARSATPVRLRLLWDSRILPARGMARLDAGFAAYQAPKRHAGTAARTC